MGRAHKKPVIRDDGSDKAAEQVRRDAEVLRANKELAAYFKGQRTEREARAAVKIIKAFIKYREHIDAASRSPLPGTPVASTVKPDRKRKVAPLKKVRRRSVSRPVAVSTPATAPQEVDTTVEETFLDPGA